MTMTGEQIRESFDRDPRVLAHNGDVPASVIAATADRLSKSTNRRACFQAHEQRDRQADTQPGLIDDEVATLTGLELVEARRRCSDLRSLGLIEWLVEDGRKVTRRSNHGRPATVCVLTPYGRQVADGWPPVPVRY